MIRGKNGMGFAWVNKIPAKAAFFDLRGRIGYTLYVNANNK
jgi:hypothetical protein